MPREAVVERKDASIRILHRGLMTCLRGLLPACQALRGFRTDTSGSPIAHPPDLAPGRAGGSYRSLRLWRGACEHCGLVAALLQLLGGLVCPVLLVILHRAAPGSLCQGGQGGGQKRVVATERPSPRLSVEGGSRLAVRLKVRAPLRAVRLLCLTRPDCRDCRVPASPPARPARPGRRRRTATAPAG